MDDEKDIKIGDIVPLWGKSFGKDFMNCIGMTYGVVIAITKKGNPRATPLYYKADQTFNHAAQSWKYMMWKSVIMFGSIPINKEIFLKEANRQSNYNNIMELVAIAQIEKDKTKKPKAHNDYFSF